MKTMTFHMRELLYITCHNMTNVRNRAYMKKNAAHEYNVN